MPAQRQQEFLEEYQRKMKSTAVAYLLWFVGCHYAYLGRWGMLLLYWVTFAGVWVWAIVDLVRIPGMIRDFNGDRATEALRNLKAISS